MKRNEWVVCPKLSLDIPIKVAPSSCMSCWECDKAFEVWLTGLKILPKINKEEWLEKKARKKGLCPKAKDATSYCNAAKSYCQYNHICSDPHPRTKTILAIMEEHMLVIKKRDESFEVSKAQAPKGITALSDIKAVYEVQRKLVLVKTLVPVAKESELTPPKIPATFKDTHMSSLLLARNGKVEKAIQLKDFVAEAEKDTNVAALIVSKIYQPTVEIKLEPVVAKPKTTKSKSEGGNG